MKRKILTISLSVVVFGLISIIVLNLSRERIEFIEPLTNDSSLTTRQVSSDSNQTGCKYLKPELDDSCTVIQHLLEDYPESPQEYLVYLDKKVWTEEKQSLSDFSYAEEEFKSCNPSSKVILKGRKAKLIPLDLPRHWLWTRQFKKQLVIYNSLEFNTRFILTDSLIAETEMGGIISTVFVESKLINNEYHFRAVDQYQENEEYELIIHPVDADKGLYVWEYVRDNKSEYAVRVAADKIKYYPLINTLSYDAAVDINPDFEPVDIDALLEK